MPQDVKSAAIAQQSGKENLEGWAPNVSDENTLREALDKAFDFRGDVTITLRNGTTVEGYVFDRRAGTSLTSSVVRLIPKDRDDKMSVTYADIAGLAFTGRDTAAGKSFETWIKKYFEKKSKGERAEILAESLD